MSQRLRIQWKKQLQSLLNKCFRIFDQQTGKCCISLNCKSVLFDFLKSTTPIANEIIQQSLLNEVCWKESVEYPVQGTDTLSFLPYSRCGIYETNFSGYHESRCGSYYERLLQTHFCWQISRFQYNQLSDTDKGVGSAYQRQASADCLGRSCWLAMFCHFFFVNNSMPIRTK